MKLRRLGSSGVDLSEIGLGTLNFGSRVDEGEAFRMLDAAHAAGVTFFDTADVYPAGLRLDLRGRSEEIVGAWARSRRVRHSVVLATKVGKVAGPNGGGALCRAQVGRGCEESLRRLQTDYLDLYQLHAPDPSTPIEETLEAMDDLVREGKVRVIGCSNYPVDRFVDGLCASAAHGWPRFEGHQARLNLLNREIEQTVAPVCRAYGIGIIAHSPLGGGVIQDRQAALSWVLSQPGVTSAIVGASRVEQLTETLASAEEVSQCV